jgi:hypothetical protein
VSKTRVGVRCHTPEKDDFNLENKGFGDFFQNKSGFLKGVSARYKTKFARKHAGFSYGGVLVCGRECHILGVM